MLLRYRWPAHATLCSAPAGHDGEPSHLSERIIRNNRHSVAQRFHRMAHVLRDDRDHAGTSDFRFLADGDFELALHDVPDFFLRVTMLVNVRALVELPMREGHL